MISVCTVVMDGMEDYLKVFLDSIKRKATLIEEIIVVKIDGQKTGLLKEFDNVKYIGFPIARSLPPERREWFFMVSGHALGLHHALSHATQEYVMFSEPDVFFLGPVDLVYYNLMVAFKLNIIGVGHFNAKEQCYLDFPCVTNCMVKRDTLPNDDWLKGDLFLRTGMRKSEQPTEMAPMDTKYLIPGMIPEYASKFPNPDGIFDVGCNLWLWNNDKPWLGFMLPCDQKFEYECYGFPDLVYPLNYNTKMNTMDLDIGDQNLLYHRTMSAKIPGNSFVQLYESLQLT